MVSERELTFSETTPPQVYNGAAQKELRMRNEQTSLSLYGLFMKTN